MGTNLLQAIANIKRNGNTDLSKVLVIPKTSPSTVNRANSVGEALEFFMKDAFSNAYNETSAQGKKDAYSEAFSYTGNQNNPPDLMLKGGDALIIQNPRKPFNFLPKPKLLSNDERLSTVCVNCEKHKWQEKDIYYVVSKVKKRKLNHLVFVQGSCYFADSHIQEQRKRSVKIRDEQGLFRYEVVPKRMKTPLQYFKRYIKTGNRKKLWISVIMSLEKFKSYPFSDRNRLNKLGVQSKTILLPLPNNPSEMLQAKLITCAQ